MLEGAAQKWLPLMLLAGIGMFFSEFLIWNVEGWIDNLSSRGAGALLMPVLGYLVYFSIFVVFADIVHRFRVNGIYGLLLLGSAYGLVLEGIFANVMYSPYGLGPAIFGVPLIHYNFTALSWHPLIDFTAAFVLFGMLLRGETGIGEGRINPGWLATVMGFCFFWFVWGHAQWLEGKFTDGIPGEVQAVALLLPIAFFGILLPLVFAGGGSAPKAILGGWTTLPFAAVLAAAAISKFLTVANKAAFAFVLFLIALYLGFLFVHLKFGSPRGQPSAYEAAFPIKGSVNPAKYAVTALVVLLSYGIFEFATSSLSLERIWSMLSVLGFFAFNAFAVLFFILAAGKTAWTLAVAGFGKIKKKEKI